MTNRRQLITGLISLVAAPAIVRATSIMPVKVWEEDWPYSYGRSPMMDALPDMKKLLRHPNSELLEAFEDIPGLLPIRTHIPFPTWRLLNGSTKI